VALDGLALPAGSAPPRFNDFRILRKVGHGGMGVVYEAEQLSLKRRVALKVLPGWAALDPRRLQRFKTEAQAAARGSHEHIVHVYGVGCESGVHYYTMELIEGSSLADIIQELQYQAGLDVSANQPTCPYPPPPATMFSPGPISPALAALLKDGPVNSRAFFQSMARLGAEAAEALEHAHQKQIVHRDVKPGNLLVDGRGSLWVADFGLAQMPSDTRLTQSGELLGTLRYMSPEHARTPDRVDHRTDVYSLGATLYELLTLQPAITGRDQETILHQIAQDDPRPPRRLNHQIPRDLETIVLAALAKAPEGRYASAREMAEDLRLFMQDLPIKRRPEANLRWLGRKVRRHAVGILLGLAVFLVSALFVVIAYRNAHRPTAEEEAARRQQEALATLTRDLDAGEGVTLVGEQGRPGYFRWRTDQTPGKLADAPDGAFTVQHWQYGILELLADPRLERYRFSAEVRHESGDHVEGGVGIYFLHSMHVAGESSLQFYCSVSFNELIDMRRFDKNLRDKGNVAGLQAHRQRPTGLFQRTHFFLTARGHFIPAMQYQGGNPWRRMAVEVQPHSITAFWEGKPIGTITHEELIRDTQSMIDSPDTRLTTKPQFTPRDGLGLFVYQAVASFRNVILEPLSKQP
jgi:serine/threonine protein kinase